MKRLLSIAALLLLAVAASSVENKETAAIEGQTVIVFLDSLSSAAFLAQDDDYIKSLSAYDVLSTMHVVRKVTLTEYLGYLSGQAREWTPREVRRIRSIARSIGMRVDRLQLNCPDTVLLIKSSGGDMDTAAYTRGNAIIISQRYVDFDDKTLERIITHELFHVISRANPALRNDLYTIIGFKKCPPLRIPEEYRKRTIANPDYPVYRYYTEIKRSDTTLPVIPVYCSPGPYRPSSTIKKHRIQPTIFVIALSDTATTVVHIDGKPQTINFNEAPDDFMLYLENSSVNNIYMFGHPDEIMAVNFEAMVAGRTDLRRQWVIDSMRTFFTH